MLREKYTFRASCPSAFSKGLCVWFKALILRVLFGLNCILYICEKIYRTSFGMKRREKETIEYYDEDSKSITWWKLKTVQ